MRVMTRSLKRLIQNQLFWRNLCLEQTDLRWVVMSNIPLCSPNALRHTVTSQSTSVFLSYPEGQFSLKKQQQLPVAPTPNLRKFFLSMVSRLQFLSNWILYGFRGASLYVKCSKGSHKNAPNYANKDDSIICFGFIDHLNTVYEVRNFLNSSLEILETHILFELEDASSVHEISAHFCDFSNSYFPHEEKLP